jgi:nucleotide-binding universal stress UspA family protein
MNAVKPAKILLTTDFSDNATCAFQYAVRLARRHGSELVVLHVVTGHSEYLEDNELLRSYEKIARERATARLARLEFGSDTGINVRREITCAWSAKEGILAFAQKEKPDLIVISTHGHRLVARMFLGSVARSVITEAPCPVLCVRCDECGMLDERTEEIQIGRILVPVDLSEQSRTALKLGIEFARTYDAQLHLMYVVHVDVPSDLLSEDSTRYFDLDDDLHSHISSQLDAFHREVATGVTKVVTMVAKGSPAKRIAEYAASHEVDLITLSRKGLGGTPHGLGCVAGRLLHDACCPTLVV